MGQQTKIEWTDHTFNPWRSCQHLILADGSVHPACEHCYAETMAKRFPQRLGKWGAEGTRIMAPEKLWRQPLAWNKAAEKAGQRARVFCASIADVFEDWNLAMTNPAGERLYRCYQCQRNWAGEPTEKASRCEECFSDGPCNWLTMGEVRRDLFALIDQTPWLDWQLLTKRPGNIRRMWPCPRDTNGDGDCQYCSKPNFPGHLRQNVWLGTSISNQQTADELIPQLLQARELAGQLFLSAEPLLGKVDLRLQKAESSICNPQSAITWVICGGESGQQARPMHPDWALSLRDQCQAAGVAFFFKQWGEFSPTDPGPPGPNRFQMVKPTGGDRIFSPSGKFSGEAPQQEDAVMFRVGKMTAGRLLDGREWNEFPTTHHSQLTTH